MSLQVYPFPHTVSEIKQVGTIPWFSKNLVVILEYGHIIQVLSSKYLNCFLLSIKPYSPLPFHFPLTTSGSQGDLQDLTHPSGFLNVMTSQGLK